MFSDKAKRGQALVIIVFAIVGLIALVALAIDGGNVFAARRRAQSAVDNASLAGALANVNGQIVTNAACAITSINGFSDPDCTTDPVPNGDIPEVTIQVGMPDGGFTACNGSKIIITHNITWDDPNDSPGNYVQVMIKTSENTFFGPVVGINQLNYCVQAIARGKPLQYLPLVYGNAIVALDCHDSGAITAWGNGHVITIDGGVFSNSDALTNSIKILKDSNLEIPADKAVTAVGGIAAPSDYLPVPIPGQTQLQIPCGLQFPSYMLPQYTCTDTHDNIPWPGMAVDAQGFTIIPPGVHCITGNFPKGNFKGTGVTIVMVNNGIKWNGNKAMLHLTPPTDDTNGTKGLLIYLPPPNSNDVTLNGTFDLDITGTVYAPLSQINVSGDFGGVAQNSQWIGAKVDLTGSNFTIIEYDKNSNWHYPQPPVVELTK